MKVKLSQKKYLLKKIAAKHIPMKVLNHRKQGFASPMAQWLKSDLKPMIKQSLIDDQQDQVEYFNRDIIVSLIEEHLQERELNNKLIFSLIMFKRWQKAN